mmetsp:Transcript_66056/g.157641  ORF Transcript_66056/g.157641 Transcript_66056/m.157641 type:complete len:406 (-) Transcript_66056:1759-2976(-)
MTEGTSRPLTFPKLTPWSVSTPPPAAAPFNGANPANTPESYENAAESLFSAPPRSTRTSRVPTPAPTPHVSEEDDTHACVVHAVSPSATVMLAPGSACPKRDPVTVITAPPVEGALSLPAMATGCGPSKAKRPVPTPRHTPPFLVHPVGARSMVAEGFPKPGRVRHVTVESETHAGTSHAEPTTAVGWLSAAPNDTPRNVTVVPPVCGPLPGTMENTCGSSYVIIAAAVPRSVGERRIWSTRTCWSTPRFGGSWHSSDESLTHRTERASALPIWMAWVYCAAPKFFPRSVTSMAPMAGPLLGARDVITGRSYEMTLTRVARRLTTERVIPRPRPTPEGVWQIIWLSDCQVVVSHAEPPRRRVLLYAASPKLRPITVTPPPPAGGVFLWSSGSGNAAHAFCTTGAS